MSKTGKEVRELQREVSRLMQEGRLAGVEQDLLEGRFKMEVVEDHPVEEEEEKMESEIPEQFLAGERRWEGGMGARKQGARFSFNKL